MGRITVDQSHQVVAALVVNADWSEIDFETSNLQDQVIRKAKEAGQQFTAFLKNGGRVIIGEPRIVQIDRLTPFNPVEFLGAGWKIEEEDERSLALTTVDLTAVRLTSQLQSRENCITGEENLNRLKRTGHLRLDAKFFLTLWQNQYLIPERWKEKTNDNTTCIFFDGTVLRNPYGLRYTLFLYWNSGEWRWLFSWLDGGRRAGSPSAVLAKP